MIAGRARKRTDRRFNEGMRAFLAAHGDRPLSEDDLVARPSWSPMARSEDTAPAHRGLSA